MHIPRKDSRVLAKTSSAILWPTGTLAGLERILKESSPATTVMSLLMMAVMSSTEVGMWGSNMMWRMELGRRDDQGGDRIFSSQDFSTKDRLEVTFSLLSRCGPHWNALQFSLYTDPPCNDIPEYFVVAESNSSIHNLWKLRMSVSPQLTVLLLGKKKYFSL